MHFINMRLIDRYILIKNKYPNYIVLIKCGNFYNTFYNDALYINKRFGYKLINNKFGFPIGVLDKINLCKYILVDNLSIRMIKQLN